MTEETSKEFRYIRDIGNKYAAIAYNRFAEAISFIANSGKKSPLCLMITYQRILKESHSAFAHQEYIIFNPNLSYIQDGFIFESYQRTAFQILECIPVYDAGILMEWQNNDGFYQGKQAIILSLDAIQNMSYMMEYAEKTDYFHLGYTIKGQKSDTPSIGINGFLRHSITHCLKADARKYSIQGQDSIAFHRRVIDRFNQAIASHTESTS